MKSLAQFISEAKFDTEIAQYDLEIISESLKDPKLIELAKYLRKFGKKRSYSNRSFSGIFGNYGVEWDKITPEDWTEYTDVESAKKAVRKIISNRSNSISSIALVTNDKGDDLKYMIHAYGMVDFKALKWVSSWDRKEGEPAYQEQPESLNNLKQYEILECIKDGCKVYVLDSSKMHASFDKQRERRNAQTGVVLQGDEQYYKELAKQNIERYKKIIAQHKAEKAAQNDTISKDVNDVLNEIMQLNSKLVKDPIKYADCTYDICGLVNFSYTAETSGKNGLSLLYLYSQYVRNHVENSNGASYSWQVDDQDKITKQLKEKLDAVKEKLAQVKEKMGE